MAEERRIFSKGVICSFSDVGFGYRIREAAIFAGI